MISLKKAVKEFRSNILSLYKEHLKLVNSFNAEDRLPADFKNKNEEKKMKINSSETVEEFNFENETETDVETDDLSSNKFSDLKFGEDYDVSKDTKEEPVGLFSWCSPYKILEGELL